MDKVSRQTYYMYRYDTDTSDSERVCLYQHIRTLYCGPEVTYVSRHTYIDELTHIRSNNQYLLLFYESRTRINVKIIDTILVNIGQLFLFKKKCSKKIIHQ